MKGYERALVSPTTIFAHCETGNSFYRGRVGQLSKQHNLQDMRLLGSKYPGMILLPSEIILTPQHGNVAFKRLIQIGEWATPSLAGSDGALNKNFRDR
jgi:hypothetical protein